MFIATVIAPGGLAEEMLRHAGARMMAADCGPDPWEWIDEGIAADIPFQWAPEAARAAIDGAFEGVDVIVQPAMGRRKRLLIADMDSTMITVECIDELADYAGIKAEVAQVTEAAMRGELDFVAALDARVALLKGLPAETIERCYAERVRLMPGAETLVRTMRANGAYAVLVSGGFTAFADRVAAAIGFHRAIANTLEVESGALTGSVARPVVDSATKLATLNSEAGVKALTDIGGREFLILALLAIAVLGMGIWPEPFTEIMHASVNDLLKHVAAASRR